MSYIATTFKEFVRHQLNEETKQPPLVKEISTNGKALVEELIEKYNELIKEYDNLSRLY
jgi:hypothetical protein